MRKFKYFLANLTLLFIENSSVKCMSFAVCTQAFELFF